MKPVQKRGVEMGSKRRTKINPCWFRGISSRDRDNANAARKLCSRFRVVQFIFPRIALWAASKRTFDARSLAGLSRDLGSNAMRPQDTNHWTSLGGPFVIEMIKKEGPPTVEDLSLRSSGQGIERWRLPLRSLQSC
jgi:hypothetical protein